MRLPKAVYLFVISVLLAGCSSTPQASSEEACDAPKPLAIFSDKHEKILTHSFTLNGHNGEEHMTLADQSQLDIFQTGCKKIAQEFRFTSALQSEIDAPALGIERLLYLARIDDQYMSFAIWADAVKALKAEFEQSKEVEVEAGFFVGLDKIDSKEKTIMVIRLFQQ